MNCDLVQRRLLGIDHPAHMPADVRAHLVACGECQAWQSQLAQLERSVPLLPVPRSRGKARLLRRLVGAPAGGRLAAATALRGPEVPSLTPVPAAAHRLARYFTRPRLAAGLAAALVVGGLGWWALRDGGKVLESEPPREKSANDPLLANLLQRDVRLATAGSPRERIEILDDMAQELQGASRLLAQAASGEHLEGLARLYEQVVREGIIKQAGALGDSERRPVLNPIADRLARTARSAERLAGKVPAEHSKPLYTIALAAREGNRHLYALASKERP